jgi:hypothetical protein
LQNIVADRHNKLLQNAPYNTRCTPPIAIRTRFGAITAWSLARANEHFDEPVLCSDVLDHAELREDSDAWLSDLVTLNGWSASDALSAPCLRFPFAVFGKKHSSGRRISAMDSPPLLAHTFPLW